MLEIILIWRLAVYIGNEATRKGLKKGRYQVMAVFLWLIGEFSGGILGTIIVGDSDSFWVSYAIALLGAIIGAGIAFLVMRLLPSQNSSEIGGALDSKSEPPGIQRFGRSGWIPVLVILLAFSCLCIVFGIGMLRQVGSMLLQIHATNPVIGVELDDGGQITQSVTEISPTTEIIFLNFIFEAPQTSEFPVTIDWTLNDQLVYSVTETLTQGLYVGKLEREKVGFSEFPKGDYIVYIHYGEMFLSSVAFHVK